MTLPIYYIPGAGGTIDHAQLVDVGLGHIAAPGEAITTRAVFAGPGNGAAGNLVTADAAAVPELGPLDRWQPMPTPSTAWLTLPPGPPPGPGDLARAEMIDGYLVPLADGSEWIVPLGRVYPAGTSLPESLAIGPDGALVRHVLPAYAAACRDAERIWSAVMADNAAQSDGGTADDTEPMDDMEAYTLACRALALNYHLGPAEVGLLGLLTTANVRRVLWAFVDGPGYLAVQAAREAAAKKNDIVSTPDGGSSGDGPPVSTPDTSQRAQI